MPISSLVTFIETGTGEVIYGDAIVEGQTSASSTTGQVDNQTVTGEVADTDEVRSSTW